MLTQRGIQNWVVSTAVAAEAQHGKECVAFLIGLYMKKSTVSCVGFDFATMWEYPNSGTGIHWCWADFKNTLK